MKASYQAAALKEMAKASKEKASMAAKSGISISGKIENHQ